MRTLAFLTDPAAVRPILRYLRIPAHPPPVAPARAPPQTELLALDPPSPWDQAGDPRSGRDPFDQSLPGDDRTWSAYPWGLRPEGPDQKSNGCSPLNRSDPGADPSTSLDLLCGVVSGQPLFDILSSRFGS